MKSKSDVLRLLSYLKPFRKKLAISGGLLVLSTIIGLLQPLIIQKITDSGLIGHDLDSLFRLVMALLVSVSANLFIEFAQTMIFANMHNSVYYTISRQTLQKLFHLKNSYFEDKSNSEIFSCLQTDVSQVSSIADQYMIMSLGYIFRIFSGLFGLFLINWKLSIIVLTIIPLKFITVCKASKYREKSIDKQLEANRDFSSWFGDTLDGIMEIKLWSLFENKEITFQAKQKKVLQLQKAGTLIDSLNHLIDSILDWIVTALLYLVGGILIYSSGLTVGSVVAFVSYFSYVTGPVSTLLNLKMHFARIIPSAKRLFRFLEMECEPDEGKSIVNQVPISIGFKNVNFSYVKNQQVLNNITFNISQGEKIAIIGRNGSGKSTILRLLLRLHEPDSGEIVINNTPISDIPLSEYRNLFSVVSQNPYLFLGNIESNIDLKGNQNLDKIKEAMNSSGVSEYAKKMNCGTKTQIGKNGTRLSGGEKQKIAVARAFVKDAPIVIFDEATSSFDVESASYLKNVINSKMKDKTIIMISHHYEDLEGMDRIYKLDNGKLQIVKP